MTDRGWLIWVSGDFAFKIANGLLINNQYAAQDDTSLEDMIASASKA